MFKENVRYQFIDKKAEELFVSEAENFVNKGIVKAIKEHGGIFTLTENTSDSGEFYIRVPVGHIIEVTYGRAVLLNREFKYFKEVDAPKEEKSASEKIHDTMKLLEGLTKEIGIDLTVDQYSKALSYLVNKV